MLIHFSRYLARLASLLALLVLLAPLHTALAEDQPLLVRTTYPFDVAIDLAKQKLAEKGYTVVFTQKCDNALGKFNYTTDGYRILMFSKRQFSRNWLDKYPEIAAFLPLRLAVFAENKDTMLASYNPLDLARHTGIEELKPFFLQWHKDIQAIMQAMSLPPKELAAQ